jgi:hypothetical protein
MSTQLATQRSWNFTIVQGLSHGRTTGDTFFLTPPNAGHFSDSLRCSDLSSWEVFVWILTHSLSLTSRIRQPVGGRLLRHAKSHAIPRNGYGAGLT